MTVALALPVGVETRSNERLSVGQAILKIVGPCNLNCSYCYMYNHEDQGWRRRPKHMSDEVFSNVVHALRRYCDRNDRPMALMFHGGEPTLIGKESFDRLAGMAREIMGGRLDHLGIQTNATLIDDAWLALFKRHALSPGISLDGPSHVHDATRVDHAGRGSHTAVVRGLERMRAHGFSPASLTVINPAFSGLEVYEYLRSIGLDKLDFFFPDVSRDNMDRLYGHMGPTPVARFLLPILDAWMKEDDPDVHIRLFWGIFHRLLGGYGETDYFGTSKMSYVVIETDGSVEVLDALRVCDEGIAATGVNLVEHELEELCQTSPQIRMMLLTGVPPADTCRACPEFDACGGGYLPHRYSKANGFDNPSAWCEDIKLLMAASRRYTVGLRPA